MKITGSLVFLGLFAAAYAAAVDTHVNKDNADVKTDEYSVWRRNPWERPGNPPPFIPSRRLMLSQIGRWWNQDEMKEKLRTTKAHNEDEEATDEYSPWGKYPWDWPGNPPPFVPPEDSQSSQIGRWWNQHYLHGEGEWPRRYSSLDSEDEATDEYRIWGKYPWEQPGNPPPFVPPGDLQFSQIGRWWNQDYLHGKREWPPRYSSMDGEDEDTSEYAQWKKFPWEKPDSPPPFVPPSDQQLSRSSRSLRVVKPSDKPWNPPPFLPERYPRSD